MDNWTKAKKALFRDFWRSEMGLESLALIKELKQEQLDRALLSAKSGKSDDIKECLYRAAGIDLVLDMLTDYTTKHPKS